MRGNLRKRSVDVAVILGRAQARRCAGLGPLTIVAHARQSLRARGRQDEGRCCSGSAVQCTTHDFACRRGQGEPIERVAVGGCRFPTVERKRSLEGSGKKSPMRATLPILNDWGSACVLVAALYTPRALRLCPPTHKPEQLQLHTPSWCHCQDNAHVLATTGTNRGPSHTPPINAHSAEGRGRRGDCAGTASPHTYTRHTTAAHTEHLAQGPGERLR
jgi:hypothetical protein